MRVYDLKRSASCGTIPCAGWQYGHQFHVTALFREEEGV